MQIVNEKYYTLNFPRRKIQISCPTESEKLSITQILDVAHISYQTPSATEITLRPSYKQLISQLAPLSDPLAHMLRADLRTSFVLSSL